MHYSESIDHPIIVARHKKYHMTQIQKDQYFKNELENNNYTLIGSILNITSSILNLQIGFETVENPGYSPKYLTFSVEYHFDHKFQSEMVNLNKGDLVICKGVLISLDFSFKLTEIERFRGKSNEDITRERESRRKRNANYFGFVLVFLCLIFMALGGWFWLGAIICGIFAWDILMG